jgi:lipase maturation factor 1
MGESLKAIAKWLLGPETAEPRLWRGAGGLGPGIWSAARPREILTAEEGPPGHLWPRWIFLRALGLIYFSAFYSLLFQIKGLIGPEGILPAGDFLQAVSSAIHAQRFWFAPSLLWFGSSDRALLLLCWAGIAASLLLFLNFWPRGTLAVCFVCFLSFIAVAQDFASYQSDGMLLEAGFIALFFAPPGFRPGLGCANAPSRFSRFLLLWEWFRIYFESGVVKIASGDLSWRNFTAMDDYYQNLPLPTWIGWYFQHLPHWFHASTTFMTLALELAVPWMMFLPRRIRIICFCIVTPFEIVIILTANYAFLNYIVLALGFLLLDDRAIEWILPKRFREFTSEKLESATIGEGAAVQTQLEGWRERWSHRLGPVKMTIAGVLLGWLFFASSSQLMEMLGIQVPFAETPVRYLEPFRIAYRYGLFAVMTHGRYEIEFQGSRDGKTWIAYPFRYKPQDVMKAPGIYAPYQPRFEWNLWFASLGSWREYRFVIWTEERLLKNSPGVLALFASDPFAGGPPPTEVRAVIWQYWLTDLKTKHKSGAWWRRESLGEYAPGLERGPDGKIAVLGSTSAPPMPSSP